MIEKNKFAKKKCTEEEKQNQQNASKYLKIQSRKLYKKANNCFCFAISDSRCCDFWCVILLKMEKMGTSLVRKWDQWGPKTEKGPLLMWTWGPKGEPMWAQ